MYASSSRTFGARAARRGLGAIDTRFVMLAGPTRVTWDRGDPNGGGQDIYNVEGPAAAAIAALWTNSMQTADSALWITGDWIGNFIPAQGTYDVFPLRVVADSFVRATLENGGLTKLPNGAIVPATQAVFIAQKQTDYTAAGGKGSLYDQPDASKGYFLPPGESRVPTQVVTDTGQVHPDTLADIQSGYVKKVLEYSAQQSGRSVGDVAAQYVDSLARSASGGVDTIEGPLGDALRAGLAPTDVLGYVEAVGRGEQVDPRTFATVRPLDMKAVAPIAAAAAAFFFLPKLFR